MTLAFALTLFAYVGVFLGWRERLLVRRTTLASMFVLPPVAFWVAAQYPYQYYKLLVVLSTLFPVGIVLVAAWLKQRWAGSLPARIASTALVATVLGGTAFATADMVYRVGTGSTEPEIGQGSAARLIDPDFAAFRGWLNKTKDRDIYIFYTDDFYQGGYMNGWIAYFARGNRTWLHNPIIMDLDRRLFKAGFIDGRYRNDPLPPKEDAFIATAFSIDNIRAKREQTFGRFNVYSITRDEWSGAWASIQNRVDTYLNPAVTGQLNGYSQFDRLQLARTFTGDGVKDGSATIEVTLEAGGVITGIGLAALDHRIAWAADAHSSYIFLGVSRAGAGNDFLNHPVTGGIRIPVRSSVKLDLSYSCFGTVDTGEPLEVTVRFADGQTVTSTLRRGK